MYYNIMNYIQHIIHFILYLQFSNWGPQSTLICGIRLSLSLPALYRRGRQLLRRSSGQPTVPIPCLINDHQYG
jgi:hypothetical protein